MRSTSSSRKVWNGSYHSRSQWVWGTTSIWRGLGAGAAHGARGPCSASYCLSSSMSRVCSLAVAGVPRPAASA